MKTQALKTWLTRIRQRATDKVDISSLAAFRVLFGLMMLVGTVRFMAYGWVDQFFVQPDFFFHYWGFEWISPLAGPWMHGVFIAVAVLSFMVAVGLFYRPAIIGFFVLFSYIELIDVANYLNHYYLVSLIALLLCFLPANAAWSVDAYLRPRIRRAKTAAYHVWLLRFQVGVVYFYAGVAKVGSDWLLHGQPLNIWLSSRVDTPLIGAFLDLWWIALAMGWAGMLHDLLMPFLLSWRKSRPVAYAVLVVFHVATGYFFRIGMFPVIMMVSATIFFAPDWPKRWVPERFWPKSQDPEPSARGWERGRGGLLQKLALAVALLYCVLQLVMPLRFVAYPGNVLWHEQGMRWSWKVMVRKKNGAVTYRVKVPERQKEYYVSPSRYLTSHQEREMSGQPDLILQLAHHIGEEFRERGHDQVEVRVDAIVSLNARSPRPMIDPNVDLLAVDDGIDRADWILPGPDEPPPHLQPLSRESSASR
ncbi:MAG: HTTM domain-containing protein [Myxococcota bacterium]